MRYLIIAHCAGEELFSIEQEADTPAAAVQAVEDAVFEQRRDDGHTPEESEMYLDFVFRVEGKVIPVVEN